VARKKTSKIRVNVKASISRRLREVRQELFGEHGGPELARRLNLPARTWYNYETGVTVPAEVLLSFIDQTGANPVWLLSGEGERYRREAEASMLSELTPIQLIRRGLEKLEQQPGSEMALFAPETLPADGSSEFIAVSLVPLAALGSRVIDPDLVEGHIMAYREWLPHPRETIAVRLDDDAMFPILPAGSVVAVDRTLTDPQRLQGKMVAASPDGVPMVRWLDLTGRHMIFRPNQTSREHPLIPMEFDDSAASPILGQVVWSWSCFNSTEY
jgi:Peptidase S24-like